MITNETVIILGAGASIPYGFPSGPGLKECILKGARSGTSWSDPIVQAGFSRNEIIEFTNQLRYSGQQSVDAFLEHRGDLSKVGKACMARCLIALESVDALYSGAQGSWYELLFHRMNADFHQFAANKITFVTYNYDRSLEHFLVTSLAMTHKQVPDHCWHYVQQLGIIHLHGLLGDYICDPTKKGREFVTDVNGDTIGEATSQLKIIHEGNVDDPQFKLAREKLSTAKVVCFLGFGYDSINCKRLRPEEWIRTCKVYGSSFGLTALESAQIKRMFKQRLHMAEEPLDCVGTLRNLVSLE